MSDRSLSALLIATVVGALLALTAPAAAQVLSVPMEEAPASHARAAALEEPPARIAERFGVEPLAELVEARQGAVDELAALAQWNRSGNLPVRVGFLRPLPEPQTVRFGGAVTGAPAGVHAGGAFARAAADATVWGTSVHVEDSYRLRLRLTGVELPEGTRMWVYAESGETVGPFGVELAHEGTLWTPSVAGPTIHLEVELPEAAPGADGAPGFRIESVAEIVRLGPTGEPLLGPFPQPVHDDCLVDATCVSDSTFPVVDLAARGIAHVQFASSPGFIGVCGGGLLNTAEGGDGTPAPDPPFLSANHCFSTQSAASSVELFWDYKTVACDGTPPDISSLPRTVGTTLLATDVESDFTLVAPSSLPSNRVFLGWNAEPAATAAGNVIHRLSHPVPHETILPLQYTQYEILASTDGGFNFCGTTGDGRDTDDTTKFIHSEPRLGGSFGGSSGAPVMLGNGQVVGQLFGACGPEPEDGCDQRNNELDGNFGATLPLVSQFLVGTALPPGVLVTPELPGFEFEVDILPPDAEPIVATRAPDCIPETLCVAGALPDRPEAFVKIIGPRPNGFLWVQISRFTPSGLRIQVRQVATDTTNVYELPPVGPGEELPGLQDRDAFLP